MIIIRNNEDQLTRLLEALKNVAPPEMMSKVLTDARMTDHDFSVLVAEVEDIYNDELELDDVIQFITNQPEYRKDILFQCLDQGEAVVDVQEYLDDQLGDKIIVDLKCFSELSEKAKKHAVKNWMISSDKEYDEAAIELEDEDARIYDVFGNVIKELE